MNLSEKIDKYIQNLSEATYKSDQAQKFKKDLSDSTLKFLNKLSKSAEDFYKEKMKEHSAALEKLRKESDDLTRRVEEIWTGIDDVADELEEKILNNSQYSKLITKVFYSFDAKKEKTGDLMITLECADLEAKQQLLKYCESIASKLKFETSIIGGDNKKNQVNLYYMINIKK